MVRLVVSSKANLIHFIFAAFNQGSLFVLHDNFKKIEKLIYLGAVETLVRNFHLQFNKKITVIFTCRNGKLGDDVK